MQLVKPESRIAFTDTRLMVKTRMEKRGNNKPRLCVSMYKNGEITQLIFCCILRKHINISLIFRSLLSRLLRRGRKRRFAVALQSVTNEMNNRIKHLINQNVKIETVRRFVRGLAVILGARLHAFSVQRARASPAHK